MTQRINYIYHYKKTHSDTSEHIHRMNSFYRGLLKSIIPEDKNIHILDVGCGMGFALLALQDMGYKNLAGVDIDCGQVESCLAKKLNVVQVNNTIDYLLSHMNRYDLILALDVIEHIDYPEQLSFVKAINNALKKNGKLICTVPNANSVLASRWRYGDWTHHMSFTELSLEFLLYNAGFDDIQIDGTEIFSRPSFRPLLSKLVLSKGLWKNYLRWVLFKFVRSLRRAEMIAEMGWEQGKNVPLSLNLIASAIKK